EGQDPPAADLRDLLDAPAGAHARHQARAEHRPPSLHRRLTGAGASQNHNEDDMKIILREDIDKLGRRGDVVKVAPGYGRNYLLPKGLAYVHTAGNAKRVEQERRLLGVKMAREKQEAEALAKRISQISTTIVRKVGENESLYGSVTNAD